VPDSGLPDGDVLTSAFYDSYIREQVVTTCTSATRPTGVEGRMIYETDTNCVLVYDGSTWLIVSAPATTYTPTLTSMAIGTGGSAANTAKYGYAQGLIVIDGIIQFGTSGTTFPASSNTITLPSTFTPAASVTPNYPLVGLANMTAGGVSAQGVVALVSTTQLRIYVTTASGSYAAAGNLATNTPGTWVAGDFIRWTATLPGTLT